MISYSRAPDIEEAIKDIVQKVPMPHVDLSRVVCVRSTGSGSRRVIARCYAMPRIMQEGLGMRAHYFIEVISEKFDRLKVDEKTRVLIHELMHIPAAFGGGFRHHRNHVTKANVEKVYCIYMEKTGRPVNAFHAPWSF